MSGKNGNGRIGKYQKRVAAAAGLKNGDQLPYAPDYFDSLICRMAAPDADWAERTFAWLSYRASGNQSLRAIHLYSHGGKKPLETVLRQADCCLELAWLEAGYPAEWLDAPLKVFREEAASRGVVPISKSRVSEGFTKHRKRGTVASDTGSRLVLVPSPKVPDIREKFGETQAKTVEYKDYCKKWNAAHPQESLEEQTALSTLKRIEKIRRADFKIREQSEPPESIPEFQPPETNGAQKFQPPETNGAQKFQPPETNGHPSLEALETLESSFVFGSRSVSPENRPTDRPPEPEEEPSLETSKPAEEMETLLLQETGAQFPGEVPGRSLCLQIIQTLADTPWDEFRIKLRGRKWKRGDVLGLTRSLAKEVRDRWIRDADRRTSPARGQPACTICTQPLNGGVVIQGAHFGCYNNAKGASG